ncbi:TetR family transcriptional regulator [Dactylosporangium matsuzakiense]|uniref:TetR family transcriptional regulator n=1 Tax=Dactylosporangium matsuzakiense TaxID=53360 RepID=A0A9W6KGI6_9ACTN|nr:TetR family transcriptional regulator [Dactylosporangium matsuzakiense]UWZ45664.1 TetR family transcriptional regulator [Dactylosporangium matsuzakiense]GLL00319.1 TetR family transcriptional regulator [Dactylosporangium matsuzakiense]
MSLVERKRQLVRDELSEAALQLVAFQGFDDTTIDQMAAAAGVSRRTFFRYFQSKEDVIIEFLSDLGRKLRTALQSRPESEPPAEAVRQALRVFTDKFWEHPEKSSRLARVTVETPALLGRYLERQVAWKATMTEELARRMAVDPDTTLEPAVLVAVAFAAFDTALMCWAREPAQDLNALVEECFTLAFR